METTVLIIQFVLLIAAVYLAFFKSYLTEKGKSAALKEDLQGLTRKVESVKDEFAKEQEILKTNLQRILTNEISYRNEERNALIEFHGIINEWLYSIDEIRFGNFSAGNVDSLITVRNKVASYYAKAGISNSKISLLITDDELVKRANELFQNALDYYLWADMKFLKLQQNCEDQKSLTDQINIIIRDYKKEDAKLLANEDKRLQSELDNLVDNYYKTSIDERKKVFPFARRYESLVKNYLKE